jgi:hypothetical protein
VYATHLHSIQELKDCITEGNGAINGALLQQVMQNFQWRLWQFIKYQWKSSGTSNLQEVMYGC